ncbi:unnamed protein product, partial [Ectocarpus sp. 12 AP-2014]
PEKPRHRLALREISEERNRSGPQPQKEFPNSEKSGISQRSRGRMVPRENVGIFCCLGAPRHYSEHNMYGNSHILSRVARCTHHVRGRRPNFCARIQGIIYCCREV